jgi:hypothetical protein
MKEHQQTRATRVGSLSKPDRIDLNIDGTHTGWWAKHKVDRLLKKRCQFRPDAIFHPVNVR